MDSSVNLNHGRLHLDVGVGRLCLGDGLGVGGNVLSSKLAVGVMRSTSTATFDAWFSAGHFLLETVH